MSSFIRVIQLFIFYVCVSQVSKLTQETEKKSVSAAAVVREFTRYSYLTSLSLSHTPTTKIE